jgi:predicted dehydrogenase
MTRDMLDAVVIATPARTHYQLARHALERRLHVFVEKPLAVTPRECESLIRLADLRSRILFVGHTFLHTAAVEKLTEVVRSGELGHICYIHSSRLNLGPVRHDVNVLWDLATHDVSIILHLMGQRPTRVHCQGLACLNDNIHDVCSLTLEFPAKSMGFVQVSWLHPDKRRRLTVVGDRQMAVYDDVESSEKVKIYDKRVVADARTASRYSYRHGDTRIPALVEVEPLARECRQFIDCVASGATPLTDGRNGLEVVRVVHAAEASLRAGGAAQALESVGDVVQPPIDRDIAARIPVLSHTGGRNGGSAR